MQSLVKRLQSRKRAATTVEVKFLPNSLYEHYIRTDLQPNVPASERKSASELTPEERKDAEENYHELTITFKMLTGEERRKWDFEVLKSMREGGLPTDPMLKFMGEKLLSKFVSAKHEPKDGSEPYKITAKVFEELLDELHLMEFLDLKNAYYQACASELERAEGNGNTAAPVGGPQSKNA